MHFLHDKIGHACKLFFLLLFIYFFSENIENIIVKYHMKLHLSQQQI